MIRNQKGGIAVLGSKSGYTVFEELNKAKFMKLNHLIQNASF